MCRNHYITVCPRERRWLGIRARIIVWNGLFVCEYALGNVHSSLCRWCSKSAKYIRILPILHVGHKIKTILHVFHIAVDVCCLLSRSSSSCRCFLLLLWCCCHYFFDISGIFCQYTLMIGTDGHIAQWIRCENTQERGQWNKRKSFQTIERCG